MNSVLTDTNLPAGIDGTDHAIDTGTISGTYGEHDVTVEATVDSPAGLTRLRARGEHSWELSGINFTTDQWRLVTGNQTIRATHVDVLSFAGAPFAPLTVEMELGTLRISSERRSAVTVTTSSCPCSWSCS